MKKTTEYRVKATVWMDITANSMEEAKEECENELNTMCAGMTSEESAGIIQNIEHGDYHIVVVKPV